MPWSLTKSVKSSKHSPTGYKLAVDGRPCDRRGTPVDVTGLTDLRTPATASSSAAPARYDASRDPVPDETHIRAMATMHFQRASSQRSDTAYADVVRATMHPAFESSHVQIKEALYVAESSSPPSNTAVLKHVFSRLDLRNPEEARLGAFVMDQLRRAATGEPISLPSYYHCTKDDGFADIIHSEDPRINVRAPRTGTGGVGAWLSTAPETSAFGH